MQRLPQHMRTQQLQPQACGGAAQPQPMRRLALPAARRHAAPAAVAALQQQPFKRPVPLLPLASSTQHLLGNSCSSGWRRRGVLLQAAGDAAADGEAPVFRAQAPAAQAPPEAGASSSGGASSGEAGSSGRGASSAQPNPSRSYSEYYRSQNTRMSGGGSGSGAAPTSPSTSHGSASSNIARLGPGHAATPVQQPGVGGGASPSAAGAQAPASQQAQPGPSPAGSNVESALKRAQAALDAAETSLETIDLAGPKPQLPPQWLALLRVARTVTLVGAASVLLVVSHAFGLAWQWAGATLGAAGIAAWGLKRRSLSQSGAIAAAIVGCCTLGCSLRMGATLLAFFFSSSKLTQYKEDLKEGLEEGAKRGGQRDWRQVLCNAGVPTLLAIAYGAMAGCLDLPLGPLPAVEAWRSDVLTLLLGSFLGYYACCCGDTWASELGSLSTDTPRLITNMQPVRRGTNGGVTLLGLSASIAGGLFVGAVFYAGALASPTLWVFEPQRAMAAAQWKLIPLGLMAGLFGSLLDSVLGATLQFTGYDAASGKIVSRPGPGVERISGLPWLSNNAVNLLSASVTSALTALVALRMFG